MYRKYKDRKIQNTAISLLRVNISLLQRTVLRLSTSATIGY